MITKSKKSISLSNSILKEMSKFCKDRNISRFIEKALVYYINELERQERGRRDIEILNANAKRFNREAEDNLQFQVML